MTTGWLRRIVRFYTGCANGAHFNPLVSVEVSLHFNGHFPGGPGWTGTRMSPFWIWLQLRMMEVVSGDDWSVWSSCKAPDKSSPPTNQHPFFLQAGCPSCRPTNSVKAPKEKISQSMDLLTPVLVTQCIVICAVCLWMWLYMCVCGSVTTLTRNCVYRSSPNWVCR